MHYVSRELAQQLTDVENDLLIIKMYKFRKFFSQPISLYPLIFFLCKMFQPNAYECCSNFGASSVFVQNVYSLYAVIQRTHHNLYLLNALSV